MSNVVTLYRVEHKQSRIGPYINADYVFISTPCSDRKPAPWQDGICDAYADFNHRFAFASIECLRKWFESNELDRLIECGYYVSVYKASRVIRGNKQVVFDIESAKRVTAIPIERIKRYA